MFAGAKLLKKNDDKSISEVDADSVLNDPDQLILVYFSAHWCPPCRGFTPLLKDFWEDVCKLNVVIIFVSSDKDEDKFKEYFLEHGDYYALPFSNKELGQALKNKCNVRGIPMLCHITKDGECKNSEVRNLVQSEKAEDVVKTLKEA